MGLGSAAPTRFLVSEPARVLESLSDHYRRVNSEEPVASHVTAWRESINCVREALRETAVTNPASRDWHLVFEYELPRERGRRPDLVVIAGGSIVVVEFKGYPDPSPAAVDRAAITRATWPTITRRPTTTRCCVLCLTSGAAAPTTIKDATGRLRAGSRDRHRA